MAEPSRYRAVQKIADGGSAEVFLGEQLGAAGFKRLVVLKRIRPELYADAQYREMLVEGAARHEPAPLEPGRGARRR